MITAVSGFGRCGSSLVMQMLVAAGMKATGNAVYPTFEDDRVLDLTFGDSRWLQSCDGRAIKILDPQRCKIKDAPPMRFIFMERNHEQQSKSQVKFSDTFLGMKLPRHARRALAGSYVKDRAPALRAMAALGPILSMTFEEIIGCPLDAAHKIAVFCELPAASDVPMSRAVKFRNTNCYDGFLEFELMQGAA